ncbi:MAG: TonB-dependent receptor [candidate division WOR-3 bacterium]|nr:TonB-dependent receptor [candidate division WOR-3 bacterium]
MKPLTYYPMNALRGVLFLIFVSSMSSAQDYYYEVEPVVVTATRYPKNIMEITKTVSIIDSSEILKYSSLSELLETVAGIDMKIRGDNIQADPSIRGSTFQQVLVMIDGVRVNDPQTGHHNLNIPVPLGAIERIEILHGTASSLYGSDACGGVINIITKKSGRTRGQAGLGSFSYRNLGAGIGYKRLGINFDYKSSAGYEPGYEYQVYTFFSKINMPMGKNIENGVIFGYLNKSFGAKNFYAPFPSWEANQAYFTSLKGRLIITPYYFVNPVLSFRTHIDTFVLDRNRPKFYANHHQSFTYGGQLINHFDLGKLGYVLFGIEGFIDSLSSTRLGQRSLRRAAVFIQIENKYFAEKLILIAGLRDDYYRKIKNSINPHFSLGYKIFSSLKLNAAAGSSFRAPSFTELYYQDPANKGDSLLKPETGRDYELAIDFKNKFVFAHIAVYHRLTENDIDWVKKSNETSWQVKNIGKTRFYGIEPSLKLNFIPGIIIKTGLSYIRIIEELPEGYISKYALRVPRTDLDLSATFFSILDSRLRYSYYTPEDKRLHIDVALDKEFSIFKQAILGCRFQINNLLDKRYEDFQGLSLPGRELKLMFDISL